MAVVHKQSDLSRSIEKDVSNFFGGMNPSFDERTYLIPLDLMEVDNSFRIEADIPGFEKNEISIEASYDHLTINVTKTEIEEEQIESNYVRRERIAKKLTREVKFNKPVDASKAEMSLENGVLTITLPIAEQAKTVQLKL